MPSLKLKSLMFDTPIRKEKIKEECRVCNSKTNILLLWWYSKPIYLCNILYGTASARGLNLMISWGAFQPLQFCEIYIHIWSTKILLLNILNMLEMLLRFFILISITFGDSCWHSNVVSLTPFSSDLFVTPLLSQCNSKMVNIQLLN